MAEPRAGRGGALARRLRAVYDRMLAQVTQPVIIHWLGEMFDPALAGYWGDDATIDDGDGRLRSPSSHANAAKVDGIKISLLDADKEIAMRRRLPGGVRMYTGDDFNYAELIAGDEHGHSRRAARHLRRRSRRRRRAALAALAAQRS